MIGPRLRLCRSASPPGAHGSHFDLAAKYQKRIRGDARAFVDPVQP